VESHLDYVDVPHKVMPRWQPVTDADLPDADVVVATWWETAEWVARLSPSRGAKAYFVQGHEVFEHVPKDRAAATYRLPLHKITVSSWLSGLMRDLYGDGDASLVPNSVDHALFHALPRGKQPVPTAGFVYSSGTFKGCRTTFEAFARVRRRLPGLRLVAFGLEEPTSGLPLPEGTSYVRRPPQDQIRSVYSQCDVWVSGSTSEGFSLPLLEAMACGCPVVSTAVGGALDFLKDGVNGHVVPVGDSAAMADRIERVLALPDAEWRALSDRARATAVGYDWDAAAVLFEEALLAAVRKSGGATP
jgi:glycosyltransferase involved in cell wall biosynthesis